MNKTLTEKVKAKCKDMGLSEEYLNGVTQMLGGNIADDSTDEAAIETCANQIMEVAKAAQGEATRWAQKKKEKPDPQQKPPVVDEHDKDEPVWFKTYREANESRLKALEDENTTLKKQRKEDERKAVIEAAFEKYKVPSYLRQHLSVPADVEDVDAHVAQMAQDFVTHNLPDVDGGQKKVASREETEAAADAFFKAHTKSN